MGYVSQQFKTLASAESDHFSSTLDVMYHTKKGDGKLFLNMINNIVDYILNEYTENKTINYQIIHIPNMPDWARELLVRFIIHKSALTFNKTTINRFEKSIQKTIYNNDPKKVKYIQDRNRYFRKLSKTFRTLDIPENKYKSLILVKEQDLLAKKTDKNPWVREFFSEKINDEQYNLMLSTFFTAFDIEKVIKRLDVEDIPAIENVFIFHSTNKSKITNSYNNNQLERLNRYGVGIKNCIVFSFSNQPFRLYHTIEDVKYRLVSSLLNKPINKYNDFEGFITFTQEEIYFLFNREVNQKTFLIDCQERAFFTFEIDQLIEQLPHNLKYKNDLALSFSKDLQNNIIKSITKEIKDFSAESFGDYFNMIRLLWLNDIKNQIETFIGVSSTIGIVLPKNIMNGIKLSLSAFFQKPNRTIRYYSLEDLKKGIKVEKLIALQYRYTDKFYKSYPNSFDPLPLKDNQKALIVINRLTHNNYYEWNLYWYKKDKNGLLFSNFRKEKLNWEKISFQRPIQLGITDYINEAESDARTYQTEKCEIYYKGENRSKEHLACERVLYKENNSLRIAELKDIANTENISIQMLDEIIEQVKNLISKNSEDKTKTELLFRQDPKFNLSESEINSSIELWKFLLKRKVADIGEEVVYDTMFSQIDKNERISFNTFNQWYNLDNEMILPRSRKHQKALLTHLGFELGSAYHRIIIAKKLSNINNSRLLNMQVETLLRRTLVNKIDEKSFNYFSELHSDIFTLLGVNNADDLNVLISLLDISLTPIERIKYDQD